MWCQELNIYIYIYHPLDNGYGFSISVQSEITTPMLKEKNDFQDFQKLAGLWLIGEVVTSNHHENVGIYGSKVAEGCSAFQRRSWQTWWGSTFIALRSEANSILEVLLHIKCVKPSNLYQCRAKHDIHPKFLVLWGIQKCFVSCAEILWLTTV